MKRRKPIRNASTKRRRQLAVYSKQGKAWLIDHPVCQACRKASATQIHHKAGRIGEKLNDPAFWLAVCNDCHYKITCSGKWARANGFSV